jgi:5-formyltetrahydrofolate cyclo-ligase
MVNEPGPQAPRGPALHSAKIAARSLCLARRDALDPAVRHAASEAIAAGVAALLSWREASVVMLTLPFGSEWNTRPLFDAAIDAGKRVVLPRVNRQTRMLDLHAVDDPVRDVELGFRGIPEPRTTCPAVAPDEVRWVLVPGVAFDVEGARLGYGGGFYDRLLPLLPPGTHRIAGAYDLQVIEHVPVAGHDARVHRIVTETRVLVV